MRRIWGGWGREGGGAVGRIGVDVFGGGLEGGLFVR